jgi:hypothetical protein
MLEDDEQVDLFQPKIDTNVGSSTSNRCCICNLHPASIYSARIDGNVCWSCENKLLEKWNNE